ncbi:beta-lactamase family protein [Tardiphaga sp. vice154]|uniref:serine hydrolase domain-containing protein n=1 Tax=Tardiphaga sp. vice154 TaxID=2592814 RepID=UPI00116588E8|nr:serine hydrolase domain-containing protein [Tardiphaga sp. vice154]QDM22586.1 beta-lactamase family protein [Tardiphaga sp. vice154]
MTVQSARQAPAQTPAPRTPALPMAAPQTIGLSPARLDAMSDAFRREIDKGTAPGVTMLVGRRGKVGYFESFGRQAPEADTPMARDSLFRIFSMTKPIVSLGILMLVEDGHLLLSDPLAKFIPEFADTRVGVECHGQLELALLQRPITIQDLLRHTSGLTYEITGNGMVQRMYQKSRLRDRSLTNAEHAAIVAGLPLICQPGAEWNYSRSTDILGRVVEVVAGQTLGAFLTERILAPLQMAETGFHAAAEHAGRLAQPFDKDPWTGDKVALFDPLEIPKMKSGGGGLVSTTMDYARFCQMLLNGGTLDGTRLIGRKTLAFMASNHLAAGVKADSPLLPPGHGFGLGFAVRTDEGLAPFAGSKGQFFWSGVAGTFFWIDPVEDLFAVFMSQGPGQREYFRTLIRGLVYAAVE